MQKRKCINRMSLFLLCVFAYVLSYNLFTQANEIRQEETSLSMKKFISVGSIYPKDNQIESFTATVYNVSEISGKTDKIRSNQLSDRQVTGNIVGIVYDEDRMCFIAHADIQLIELNISIETDDMGRFAFTNVPEGFYTFSIMQEGYETAIYTHMPVSTIYGDNLYSFYLSQTRSIQNNYLMDATNLHINDNDSNNTQADNIATERPVASQFRIGANYATLTNFTINYNGVIYGLDYQEYLYHVVANEAKPATDTLFYSDMTQQQILEVFKAQAVVSRGAVNYYARTGTGNHADYTMCSTECCQRYVPYYTNSMAVQAVDETENTIPVGITNINGVQQYSYFYSSYFSLCTGYTRTPAQAWPGSVNSPYLQSVTCSCPSSNATIYAGKLPHRVGMCQAGARDMAKSGYSYQAIISHYYSGAISCVALNDNTRAIKIGESINAYGSSAIFYFYAPATADYTFKMKNSDFSSADEFCFEIYSGDTLKGSRTQQNALSYTIHLTAGVYEIWADCDSSEFILSVGHNLYAPAAVNYDGTGYYNYIYDCAGKTFQYKAPSTGSYTISTVAMPSYNGYADVDTKLEILSATGSVLYTNDNYGASLYSQITCQLSAGTTYYFRMTQKDGENISCYLKVYKN